MYIETKKYASRYCVSETKRKIYLREDGVVRGRE